MKTKDLMIGDWVNVTAAENIVPTGILSILPKKGKVVGNDGECIYVDFVEHPFMFGDIEPIPLTPEILEKNGFVARYAYGQKKWHIDIYNDFHRKFDDNGDITLNVYSERKMEWRLSIDTGRNERTVIYIRFIHELQNALRLCGIEKEVVL